MYKIRFSVHLALLSLILICPLAAVAGPGFASPGVLPPGSHAYGATLGEWSAEWWQWAMAIPADENPIRDENGENCGLDQSGRVWFLAGTELGPPGSAVERECTIPAGKAILFPVLNLLFFNCPDESFTEQEMRETLDFLFTLLVCNLECEIDGVPVENLDAHRTQSPAFVMTLPEDNLLLGNCEGLGGGPPAADYFPVVSEGVWILHAPLSVGEHEIFLRGALCDPGSGEEFAATEVTYLITIVDASDDD